jgi:hypothetical protein
MTERLEYDALAGSLNTKFGIHVDDANTVEAELTDISEHLLSKRQERFAVVFRVPNETYLGQGMRHLQHETLGEFDLFLVPISRDDQGTCYEAVFNRFRQGD